jgi:histidinol-phosphate aminotransferase
MPQSSSRREWLKTSALSAAALAVLPRVLESQTPPDRSLKPIKLSSNENPYGFSPNARRAVIDSLADGSRYADPMAVRKLEETIAAREGLRPENVVLATGSGEILCMAAVAFGKGEIVAPTPTFPTLMTYAERLGAVVRSVPLTAKFEHDLDTMTKAVTDKTSIVYTCNPNNPTGAMTPNNQLRAFISETAKRVPVFVDEAYLEYTEDFPRNSAVDLVRKGENVIISRTFSKIYGMAGMRVGYGLARPDVVQRLRNFRMTWLNHISMRAALAAYEDQAFIEDSKKKNTVIRKEFLGVLDGMKLRYAPTDSNFVWANVGQGRADLGDKLRAHNILLSNPRPPEAEWVRITIGTREEMEILAKALRVVLSA